MWKWFGSIWFSGCGEIVILLFSAHIPTQLAMVEIKNDSVAVEIVRGLHKGFKNIVKNIY